MSFSDIEDNIIITLKNYRNIDSYGLTFEIVKGTTFFIGLNNVGKSNLLKFFYEFRPVFKNVTKDISVGHFDRTDTFNNGVNVVYSGSIRGHGIASLNETINRINITTAISKVTTSFSIEIKSKFKITFTISASSNSLNDSGEIECSFEIGVHKDNKYGILSREYLVDELGNEISNIPFYLSDSETQDRAKFKELYEDILKILSICENSFYIGAARTSLKVNSFVYYDLILGDRFLDDLNTWSFGNNIFLRKQMQEATEEIRRVLNFPKLAITLSDDKRNILVTTNDGIFDLSEMGSGISHIILLIFYLTMNPKTMIFIDEPEMSLHPAMQKALVKYIASKAKYSLVMSTHSIGLAISAGDVVYELYKAENERVKIKEFRIDTKPRIISQLNDLGYSHFCDIGGDILLLVEGITDVKIFREIVSKLNLGSNFIIWHLGGSSLISENAIDELSEIERLNPATKAIIIDSERTKQGEPLKGKFENYLKMVSNLGFKAKATEFHSTENYITQRALEKVFPGQNKLALKPYEKFEEGAPNRWKKADNFKLFQAMNLEEIEDTDLGHFLKSLVKQ